MDGVVCGGMVDGAVDSGAEDDDGDAADDVRTAAVTVVVVVAVVADVAGRDGDVVSVGGMGGSHRGEVMAGGGNG